MNDMGPRIELGRPLDPPDLDHLIGLARNRAGLDLSPDKEAMIRGRVFRRMRVTGHSSPKTYLDFIATPGGQTESDRLVAALTTNVTRFFREPHHFDWLARHVAPNLGKERAPRLWSAGAANGMEAYSVAITLAETMSADTLSNTRILATDLCDDLVHEGAQGRYSARSIDGLTPARRARFFIRDADTVWRVRRDLRSLMRFRVLNLLDRWPMRQRFHAIFCRNVLIYFDLGLQERIATRLAEALVPGGTLFLGHSERLPVDLTDRFEAVATTVYRKHEL